MQKYTPTIGLEIHAELKTKTKMFCDSPNDPDENRPNQNVCPVCMAHPGTLPTINKEAVKHVLRIGTAVGGSLADFTEFDRKSYFYPDIPKGYQISQYEHPLVSGGSLAGVELTRVHLEEDTARSSHAGGVSLVDFNRAGVPLMELVTEPVIHDAATAGNFARELQLLLRTLGASDANLEKGEMRIEANISVSAEEGKFGTKTEVKNLNSFRSVERAIEYEIKRQTEALLKGEKLIQETRGWDEGKQQTFHQRTKEGSADYRYFPEPDLPKLVVSDLPEFSSEALSGSLPELPWKRRERYESLGIAKDAVAHIGSDAERSFFFDTVLEELSEDAKLITLAANYLVSDVEGWLAKDSTRTLSLRSTDFAKLMRMVHENKVSSRGAKEVLAIMLEEGGNPEVIAKEKGLEQVSDTGALRTAVQGVIERNASVASDYRAGKEAALQFLVGQGMKETKGAGNPAVIRELLIEELAK
jgi:aspartyl-tRNA(Asn)/glutamyl-tRNA(Gln) amidotransferase subunit B